MHTYLIRNTNDHDMKFTTVGGNITLLKPNECLVYKSERDDLHPILQREYNKGNIDFWLSPEFIENADLVEPAEKIEWKIQGF